MDETVDFYVNGKPVSITGGGNRPLLWVLRDDLGLTGTKFGCGEGLCGACTVLVDGKAVKSCQTAIAEVAGKRVVTIEGLATGEGLHPLQKSFIEHYALQCGYCTPGMIMKAVELLSENPEPSREEIIVGMEDNLCRCGAYDRIIDAIQDAARQAKGVS